MTILGLKKKVESLNVETVSEEAVSATSENISEENKKQLFEGFDKEQQKLSEYRNPVYAEVKNRMNPLPGFGNPDLKKTGAFYQGIQVRVEGAVIRTDSSDPKNDALVKKYGDIFGLGGKFKAEYISKFLRPAFFKQLEQATGLKPRI